MKSFHGTSVLMFLLPLMFNVAASSSRARQVSPCPLIFTYNHDQRLGNYGHIMIRNDHSGKFELEVNASFPVPLEEKQNIKLQLVTAVDKLVNGNVVEYDVIFPVQDAVPKVTQIKYNGLVICKGPPHNLVPGGTVTAVWAKTMASIGRQKSPGGNQQGGRPNQPGGYPNQPGGYPNQPGGYPNQPGGYHNQPGGYGNSQGGYPNQPGGYGNSQGGYPNPQGGYPNPNGGYPNPSGGMNGRDPIYPNPMYQNNMGKIDQRRSINTCGMARNSQNLVVGGEQTSAGDFPWLVAILYRQGNDYKFKCTGNLISEQHIITAGHCLRYYNAPLINNDDLVVVLGKHNIENWAHGSIIRNVKEVLVHPQYKQDNADSDVAIILMNEPIVYRADVRPVCLWDGSNDLEEVVGKPGTVVGWGKSNDTVGFASIAMKVDMPVIAQEKCLRSNKIFKKLTSDKTFCAGKRNGKGPCTGDSGAGFIMQNEVTKQWMLRGLTGFTLKDSNTQSCDLNNFIVFSDVSKVQDWVKKVINVA